MENFSSLDHNYGGNFKTYTMNPNEMRLDDTTFNYYYYYYLDKLHKIEF